MLKEIAAGGGLLKYIYFFNSTSGAQPLELLVKLLLSGCIPISSPSAKKNGCLDSNCSLSITDSLQGFQLLCSTCKSFPSSPAKHEKQISNLRPTLSTNTNTSAIKSNQCLKRVPPQYQGRHEEGESISGSSYG
uniref:PPUP7968 n=1 Tax=Poeciliopsis prolifica TaxID=188132 RepID=A0A0S7ETR2_9TELE